MARSWRRGPALAARCCRYERLEEAMSKCYPNLPLRPAPEELRELFKVVQ
jgi:hypothetical protein